MARKIRDSCVTVQPASVHLDDNNNNPQEEEETLHEIVAAETLNLCAKQQKADAALHISRLAPASNKRRSRTISILGHVGRNVDALNVLTMLPPLSTTSPPFWNVGALFAAAVRVCLHTRCELL